MKKGFIVFVILLLIGLFIFVESVSAATINAASCSYTDVSSAISSANLGDTVNVPAGTCTWSSTLTINKGINLIGAGVGNTIIIRGGGSVIFYIPLDYSLNAPFRLSGFSFNGAGGDILKLGKELYPDPEPHQTSIRVDNNRFYSSTSLGLNNIAIEHFGNMFGVVNNNIIDNYIYPMRNQNPAAYAVLWNPAIAGTQGYPLFLPGSIYNLYFEDNIINLQLSGGEAAVTNSQYEGRYAYRYNTINFPAGGQSWYLFDVHGYQGTEMHSPFGSENYGNLLITSGSSIGYVNIRGGINLWHHNSATTSVSYGYSSSATSCPATIYQPYEPVHDSYTFLNRVGFTGELGDPSTDDSGYYSCGGHSRPLEGTDYFDDVDSTPGVTCGTLANLPSTCSIGQGYWATSQSCIDLTGMVGKNPSNPILGTLYKCTATNVWTSFYTPLQYPHPLREIAQTCSADSECNDGLYCNGVETCPAGTCVAGTNPCTDDSYSCTALCDEVTDSCNVPSDILCSDGNICTTDSCVGAGGDANGCFYSFNTFSCNDNNACTSGDICSAGSCTGSQITQCINGDGCCPFGCTEFNDADCSSSCQNLVALYHLDGDAIDSANSNDGIVDGATYTASGKYSGAFDFDGVNDYIDLNNLDVDGSALTISAWINANTFTTDDARIISKSIGTDEQDHYWMLSTISNNGIKLRFRLKTEGITSTLFADSGDLSTEAWVHVVVTYDGSNMYIYKDSVQVGSLAKTGTIDTNNLVGVNIGRNPDGYGEFDGTIDELAIWNRALTSQEVLDLYNSNAPITCGAVSNCGNADSDTSGDVSITEIINYISQWKLGSVTISELMIGIGEWKNGC